MSEPLISYAQNQEDVVLHRLVGLVPDGRYVDVGAGHPVHENVTYLLYLEGWRGIDVEPMAREAAMLRHARPDDVVIEAALGAAPGEIELFEAPLENRGATTADARVAERYRSTGQPFPSFTVAVRTLDDVLDQNPVSDLHLIKIDVEGAELDVLRGFDLARHRPWVLVMEATEPNSTTPAHHAWEPLVLGSGYVCTLFDGLNRFYVRADLTEVIALLSAPANVFDRWIRHTEAEQRRSLDDTAEHLRSLESSLSEATDSLAEATSYAASLVERAERAERYAADLEAHLRDGR